MLRKKNCYSRGTSKKFRISRSKVDDFINCPRCFWLDRVKGLDRTRTPTFAINNAVDRLLKNEFDHYRKEQVPHPLFIQEKLNYLPFEDTRLDGWQENFTGVQYYDKDLDLTFTGAIDDLWFNEDSKKVIVVDYKATSKEGEITLSDDGWWPQYKRQMEFYQFLLRMNEMNVENYGFFLYANGIKKGFFNKQVKFNLYLIKYEGDTSWIPGTLKDLKSTLDEENVPEPSKNCDYCRYFEDRQDSFRRLNYGQNMNLFDRYTLMKN
jgi:CRISPR/Cas system-associated exonuclease Cas4 (RecB family)